MNFSEILLDVYDRTGHGQAPDAAVQRRMKRFVNRWVRKVLTQKGAESLRRSIVTLASVADQPTYGVAMQNIRFITESTTERQIYKKDLGWYRDNFPAPLNFSGTPLNWVPMGLARIHTRPSTACELFIVSTAGADAGTVRVEAIRSNGYRVSLSHVLTGLVPVSLSTLVTDVIDIESVTVSAAQTGEVTVTEGNGGTELSKIRIGQTAARFFRLALVPTPSQAITYALDGIAEVVDLVNDTDEPFTNPDWSDIYTDGAVHDEWMNLGRTGDARELSLTIEGRMRELRASILEWPDASSPRSRTFDETLRLPVT